ncbi:MAG TPA: diguanylate cyclase [Candidatus Limnocylindria bacterium]|nr:diguanylate cyclase [Candidatus Limnocylindria bacterium]
MTGSAIEDISDAAIRLLSAESERDVVHRALELLGDTFGYGLRYLLLYQPGTRELVMAGGQGPGQNDPAVSVFRTTLDRGLTGAAARERRVVNVGNVFADDRFIDTGTACRSEICVPIAQGDELLGVLSVQSPELNAFGEDTERVLASFCHLVAFGLLRSRSLEARSRDIAQLGAVSRVAQVATSLDLDATLRCAVESFQELTTSDSTAIYLWNAERENLRVASLTFDPRYYATDYEQRVHESIIRLGEGMVGWAAEHREPALIDDVAKDGRPRAIQGTPLESKSAIVVPLLVENGLIGVIRAVKIGVGSYTQDQFRLAQTLGNQVGLAVAAVRAYHEANRLAITDSLTGLPNARQLSTRLIEEVSRAKRHERPLTLTVFDSDHLKVVNDRFGHGEGNRLLGDLAHQIRSTVRTSDFVARFGGDEFVLIAPETHLAAGIILAERVRAAIASRDFSVSSEHVRITVSAGVAALPEHPADPDELFRLADGALYEAKRRGRDQVAVAAI